MLVHHSVLLFLIFYSHSLFLDLAHILPCFLSSSNVHDSVLTFTFLYRNCYKAQPKNPPSVDAYSCIWKQELISSIFHIFPKKNPSNHLGAASQCPSEDSAAPACAEELFWGLPAQFCSSQGEEMRELWMHSGHVPSKGHAYLHGNEGGNEPLVLICTQGSRWLKTSQSWNSENSWLLFLFSLCFLSGCKRRKHVVQKTALCPELLSTRQKLLF